MCRIAGIASSCLPLAEMERSVGAMCRALRHGGPDDEGLYTDAEAGLVLGHRRLSLLDLEKTGHQPMQYQDGRYTISFNGEIYNYRELKTELLAIGCRFRSASDTEVILAAFASWGTAAFALLNGMFAFALFDRQTAALYLVRDLLGIKPLYYTVGSNGLAFASEVRAFHHLPVVPEEDPHWPVYLMAYGHLPEPVTTLQGVKPLPKGTFLHYNLYSGRLTTSLFETLSFYEKEMARSEAVRQVKAALQKAVSAHLIADAPLGVFLSGGVDSSVVALLAGREKKDRLRTLSIGFREPAYSEKKYQQAMQQQLGSDHLQYQLEKEEFHYHLPDVLAAMDLPSSDGINTWFISRCAAQMGLKAVLSGLGGDELFGGYPSFRRMRAANLLQGVTGPSLRSAQYLKERKLRRLAYLRLPELLGRYLFLRGHFNPLTIARYLDMDEEEVWFLLENAPQVPDVHHLTAENQASWMELHLYLQNQLLRDTDVMSMAHGVEIRVPMLDKEFVRLALHLPTAVKYSGPPAKGLLIEAFRPSLPTAVWNRKKMGFSFPFAEWLKEDEWVRSRMMSGNRAAAQFMAQFDRGQLHWSGLMSALLLRTKQYAKRSAFLDA